MDNITPLHEAAYNGNYECAEILIKHGANVNARNIDNSTPLNEAVCKGHLRIARLLIANGATPNPALQNSSPLHDAALSDQEECLDFLIECGAYVEAQDGHYGTALHIASFKQNVNCIRLLLNAGSNVNSLKMHLTPLHYATDAYRRECSDDVIRILLEAGANCHMRTLNGRLPIDRVPPTSSAATILRRAMYEPRTLANIANISVRKSLQPIRDNIKKMNWLPNALRMRILLIEF